MPTDIAKQYSGLHIADGLTLAASFAAFAELDCENYETGRFFLRVSAASGTDPTLDIEIRTQINATNYLVLERFPTFISTGSGMLLVNFEGVKHFHPNIIIGGTTPSFTIDLSFGMN